MPYEHCISGINTSSSGGDDCGWDGPSGYTGIALFYGPSKLNRASFGLAFGFDKSYVPFTDMYKLRTRACAAKEAGNCTIARTTEYFDAVKSIKLNSSTIIFSQQPDFGGGSGMLSTWSQLCFTFVSSDGTEWKTKALITCQDALMLPETPSFCYLNMGQDFNVDMGTMERGTISTVPGSTTKKTVPLKVVCTRDASVSATFTLHYTPVTIVGHEVVSSTTKGVGVAVFLNDKMMSTSDSINMDFTVGITEINLGFEVVRDPYINVGNIATGDFSADAVLIMTKN